MRVKIKLLSDTIFGSGFSIPGREDISILTDENGFPYLKASTFKGIFKEELINYINWTNDDVNKIKLLFGESTIQDDINFDSTRKLKFSDFELSHNVKAILLQENYTKQQILDALSSTRVFTNIEDGLSKEGSLRSCRCLKLGLIFYGEIEVNKQDTILVSNTLKCIKWLGSMKTRGFGKVEISELEAK